MVDFGPGIVCSRSARRVDRPARNVSYIYTSVWCLFLESCVRASSVLLCHFAHRGNHYKTIAHSVTPYPSTCRYDGDTYFRHPSARTLTPYLPQEACF